MGSTFGTGGDKDHDDGKWGDNRRLEEVGRRKSQLFLGCGFTMFHHSVTFLWYKNMSKTYPYRFPLGFWGGQRPGRLAFFFCVKNHVKKYMDLCNPCLQFSSKTYIILNRYHVVRLQFAKAWFLNVSAICLDCLALIF